MAATDAPRPLHRRPRVLALAVVAGLATGLALDVLARGPAAGGAPPYEALGRTVTVDGRAVYLDCRGEPTGGATPTVILEAGFASGASGWGPAFNDLASFARVCAWDRPGIGRSDPRGRHSAAEAMADLWTALAAAGERGPYVVAGHSLGGVYARILAGAHPAEVRALLLIDAYIPDLGLVDDPDLPSTLRDEIERSLRTTAEMLQAGEDLDWARTLVELEAASPFPGPAIALSVDQAGRYPGLERAVFADVLQSIEAGLHRLVPEAQIEIVPGAGHMIHLDRPALVVERIRELWGAAQRSP